MNKETIKRIRSEQLKDMIDDIGAKISEDITTYMLLVAEYYKREIENELSKKPLQI